MTSTLGWSIAVILLHLLFGWRLAPWLRRRGSSPKLVVQSAFAFLVSGGLLYILFTKLQLDLDQHSFVLWTWVALTAFIVGFCAAARVKRVPSIELTIAAMVAIEAAIWLSVLENSGAGLSSAPFRMLLVAPALIGLSAYCGASFGYLTWGTGRFDFKMGYEALVGRRFLLSKSSPVLSTVTTISIVGVTLGVWLVAVSLGILSGFEDDLRTKIIGANAHAVIQTEEGEPFAFDAALNERIQAILGVHASSPVIETEVAIASASNYTVALMFGIEPERSKPVLHVLSAVKQGSLDALQAEMRANPTAQLDNALDSGEFVAPAPIAGIAIGSEMAKVLNVTVGDKVRVISPALEVLTPIGVAPRSLAFRIEAIFSSKMYEYDARYAYISLAAAQRFLQWDNGLVSGLQLLTNDPEHSSPIGERVLATLNANSTTRFVAVDWKQRNQTLFASLKLERMVAFIVLVFIILVASFSIVNTLTMSIIEKSKEIAILKTMGARDVGIMKIFLVQGLLVGGFGTLIGAALAWLTVIALQRFGFWIPGEVYYIDALPVNLEAADLLVVMVAALLIVWNFAVFPALRGARLLPVEGLRDG